MRTLFEQFDLKAFGLGARFELNCGVSENVVRGRTSHIPYGSKYTNSTYFGVESL